MSDRYEPKSAFLRALVDGSPCWRDDDESNEILDQLIQLMSDEDVSNRDWSTFLLSQAEIDMPVVVEALLKAAGDASEIVRAEAVLGLARIAPHIALPYIQEGLRQPSIPLPMLEAAAACPHPSLIADLQVWAEPSDNDFADFIAADALAKCLASESGK
jgi:HEAT repeat protein